MASWLGTCLLPALALTCVSEEGDEDVVEERDDPQGVAHNEADHILVRQYWRGGGHRDTVLKEREGGREGGRREREAGEGREGGGCYICFGGD